MADAHALGPAGGAGGVDEVGQVVDAGGAGRGGVRRGVSSVWGVVQQEQAGGQPAQRRQQAGFAEQDGGAAVCQHVVQPLGRVGRVQRQIDGAGLQRGQQRGHRGRAARQQHAHHGFRAGAQRLQPVGQLVGAGVQPGVIKRAVFVQQRRRARSGGGLALEQALRQLRRRQRGPGGVGYPRPPRFRRQQLDGGDGGVRSGDQAFRHGEQALQQCLGRGVRDAAAVEGELDGQGRARDHGQRQRIIGVLAEARSFKAQAGGLVAQQRVGGVVLEDQQRVEQLGVVAAGPALDVHQPVVGVVLHLGLIGLYLGQQRARVGGGVEPHPQRQGVDEQPYHFGYAGQIAVAAGQGGAEDDVLAVAAARQGQRPGGLEQGVQRAGASLHRGGGARAPFRRQPDFPFDEVGVAVGGAGEQGGVFQPGKVTTPEPFVRAGAAAGAVQPADIGGERPRRRQGRGFAAAERAVQGQQLAEEQGQRPAVQQQVVIAPDPAPAVLAQPDQRQPHQRRGVQGEGPRGVCGQVVGQRGFGLGQIGPVQPADRQRRSAHRRLQRLGQAPPVEAGAQQRMARQHRAPGLGEGVRVQRAVDHAAELFQVSAVGGVGHAVEQHALLQRGQRIEIVEGAGPARQLLDGGLFQTGQRVIGGQQRRGFDLVQRQRQFAGEGVGPAGDGGRLELAAGVAPVHAQPAVQHDQHQIQREGAQVVGGAFSGNQLGPQLEPGLVDAARRAQVVETDFRQAGRLQLPARVQIRPQPARLAVFRRDGRQPRQLRGDGSQEIGRAGGGGVAGHAQRIQRGEPAHGAGQVQAGFGVAAMVFHRHSEAWGVEPGRQRAPQRQQQQGADALAGCPGAGGQQAAGQGRVQFAAEQPRGGFGIGRRGGGVAAQRRETGLGLAEPRRGVRLGGLGPLLFRPAAPVGWHGGELRRFVVRQRVQRLVQIVQQNAPGHRVHRQVVDDQRQHRRLWAAAQQERAGQRAGAWV